MALPRLLIEQNRITATHALAALDRMRAHRPPIGRIALEEGWLGIGPCLHILDQQLDESRAGTPRRFGEIAVALGYLSVRQVQALLQRQAERMPSFDRVLVQMGALDAQEWQAEVRARQRAAKAKRMQMA
ncbi:MAG: hypothetical protein MJE66_13970 [Proteobacteria bacterium]|nr:hypothetical protein [Pseudomonadota bacterium]